MCTCTGMDTETQPKCYCPNYVYSAGSLKTVFPSGKIQV